MSHAPPSTPAPPDWSAQVEEIHCPLCEYNLRGLIEPRCPECGHTFEWQKLLDPPQRVHPYLVEHHPRRNTWSYLKTCLGAWRLWQAYRRYLRFDHAAAVVLSVEIIFALLLTQFVVSTQGFEAVRNFLFPRRW